eukprot:3000576-Rhodomonas_salina.2
MSDPPIRPQTKSPLPVCSVRRHSKATHRQNTPRFRATARRASTHRHTHASHGFAVISMAMSISRRVDASRT